MLSAVLSTTADGRWQPSIGDPTLMGWLTVAAYAAGALLAFQSAQRAAHEAAPGSYAADARAVELGSRAGAGAAELGSRAGARASTKAAQNQTIARFWRALALLLVLLGINKQLDLQTLFTQLARDLALAQGWYEERHRYQVLFIALVSVLGLLGTLGLVFALRKVARRIWLALLGVGFLVSFVLIRAASFHHVDLFLREGPIRLNWVFELSGIGLIALAARRARSSESADTR